MLIKDPVKKELVPMPDEHFTTIKKNIKNIDSDPSVRLKGLRKPSPLKLKYDM